jgi:hypothetical protein
MYDANPYNSDTSAFIRDLLLWNPEGSLERDVRGAELQRLVQRRFSSTSAIMRAVRAAPSVSTGR